MFVPGRIQRLSDAPGGFARNVSVASRLALVVVLVALVSVVVTSIVGLNQGSRLADTEIEDQLSAVGAARADEVQRYVRSLERAVVGQALTPRPAIAIAEFTELFRQFDAEPVTARDQERVELYYREVVAPELSEARDRPVSAAGLLPVSSAAITLQARYVVPDPETGLPPGQLTGWSESHDQLDAALSELALRVGLEDLYLIEPEAFVVVYSTDKRIDFATSLRTRSAQRHATGGADRQPQAGPVARRRGGQRLRAVPAGGRSTERFRGESGVSRR